MRATCREGFTPTMGGGDLQDSGKDVGIGNQNDSDGGDDDGGDSLNHTVQIFWNLLHYIAQVSFKPMAMFLFLPPECGYYRCARPCFKYFSSEIISLFTKTSSTLQFCTCCFYLKTTENE